MNKCLNCGKEIVQKEGARERKFCDNQNKCKQAYHNKIKREPKYVQKDKYDRVVAELEKLKSGQWVDKKEIPQPPKNGKEYFDKQMAKEITKHPLWKEGDPAERTMAFFMKYDANTYDEIKK